MATEQMLNATTAETTTATKHADYAFDQATDSCYIGESDHGAAVFAGRVNMDWAIGQAPAGGYVIALSLNAVLQHCSSRYQQHPVALNTFFFKKTEAGPFVVEISDLKPSKRGFCVIKAIMRQPKNREAIVPQRLQDYDPSEYVTKTHSIITMANMDGEKGLTYETLEAAKPPSTETMQHSQMDFMHQYIDIYQDMSTYPIRDQASGKTICPGRPEVHHSVCFKDGRETDFKSIPFWADLFIHPMYSLDNELLGGPSWMPTLQLEVQFKSVPKHVKRVLASFKVPHIINGRFDLDGALFDQDKNLLATTRHQCLVVPWERNTPSTAPSKSSSLLSPSKL